jgi:molybdopterin molybdotransferase
MITFAKALEIVLSQARPLPAEQVPLPEALGRILAQDVACDMDMPPFDKSAMDGYACKRAELPGPFHVIETIQAGAVPEKTVQAGECAKIMTGAMLPRGADCVIMVENTHTENDERIRFTGKDTASNICARGEDVLEGDIVMRKGVLLTPRHIAVLAMAGCARPSVSCRPRVGVIATGGELVEPGLTPGPSQIRNSNSYQICAQMEATGASVAYYGIVPDDEAVIDAVLKHAISRSDVILLSGGVSMGDFDLVPDVMRNNGIEILFDAIAVKPGKPTTFGVGASVFCFGLPGNPVSTFVQCEVLVKPFLYALMGHCYQPKSYYLPLAEDYRRKKAEREAWVPVVITPENTVRTGAYHGSAHINALSDADGLLNIPIGVTDIEKGTPVHVRSF